MVVTARRPDAGGAAPWRGEPFRSLLRPPHLVPERVFYHNIWFRTHPNPRYLGLLPNLPRLDAYLATCSDQRVVRGLQFRVLRGLAGPRHRAFFAVAARHYCFTFSSETEQLPHVRGPVVVDVDDPTFTEREAGWLNLPNVRAYVVTDERAGRRYEAMGVRTPFHVIPQGVSVAGIDAGAVEAARSGRRPDEVVVGYVAAWLLASGDRGGENPLHNIDHLFELWEEIHARVPGARLWLVGEASERVRARAARRDDIVMHGRLTQPETLARVAAFDIALYPRTADQGIQAQKVAEYIGMGVPVVSYDYEVTRHVREAGAGLLVSGAREFVDAVVLLALDPAVRAGYAEAAAAAGRALDWRTLADRYEREIFDVHLR